MSYLGCLVSLNCGDVLGTFQGQVQRIDNSTQSLTISQPFRNGVKCEVPEVTISACDIKELKIVKTAGEAERIVTKNATPSKLSKETAEELDIVASPGRVREKKPRSESVGAPSSRNTDNYSESVGVPVPNATNHNQYTNGYSGSYSGKSTLSNRYENCNNKYDNRLTPTKDRLGYDEGEREQTNNGYNHRNGSTRERYDEHNGNGTRNGTKHTPIKDEQFRSRRNSASEDRPPIKTSLPRKIEMKKKTQSRQNCFSAPVDSILDEFDFEKNLALFDKKAVFEEIEAEYPEELKVVEKPTKYRFDENVLQGAPVVLQQIKVPANQSGRLYVTDSGLVVPSMDYDLRNQLFDGIEACGYSVERRIEMIGRSSSEMVLQLLGGSSRLTPQNGHQLPTVVVLCGPHIQGAQGINCARHLVSHGVKTIVFLPNFLRMVSCVEQELNMYDMCDAGKRYSNIQDIPTSSIDMIVNCLDSHENSFHREQAWYQSHVHWMKQSRAPVFSIDPPIETLDISAKWCLYPVLPLAMTESSAQVYLCDLGVPKKVFKDVGITYRSPFTHKFITALHLKE